MGSLRCGVQKWKCGAIFTALSLNAGVGAGATRRRVIVEGEGEGEKGMDRRRRIQGGACVIF